jgi:hypothetical protein
MGENSSARSTPLAPDASSPVCSVFSGHRWEAIRAARVAGMLLRTLATVMLLGLPISAQSPGVPTIPSDPVRSSTHFPQQSSPNAPPAPMQARRITALNQLRHKEMVNDAGRLLVLAQELNAESANLSPAERMRKAAEIEKLAKSVRDKMSYVVGDEPAANNYTSVLP